MPDSTNLTLNQAEVRVETRLTAENKQRRDNLIRTIKEYQAKSIEAAEALATIKDDGLYAEDGNFGVFARKHFGIGQSRAYQLASAGRICRAFQEAGIEPLPTQEAQVRPLTKLGSLDEQQDAWQRAVDAAGDDGVRTVTMEHVLNIVHEKLGDHDLGVAQSEMAVAKELRGLASDEFEAGRMLGRVYDGIRSRPGTSDKAAARAFERFVRDEVGRSMDWAEQAMAYAETFDDLDVDQRPTIADFERHASLLAPLARIDMQTVWERLAEGPQRPKSHSPQAVSSAVRDVVEAKLDDLSLDPIKKPPTVNDLEKVDDVKRGKLSMLVDVALVDDDSLRALVEDTGEQVAPSTFQVAYDALDDTKRDAVIDAVVAGMRVGRDMPDDPTHEQSRLADGQRQMVRIGFETDLATWAWPVLTPAAHRFARAWLPEDGVVSSSSPCLVPRRLLQPAKTRRKSLTGEKLKKREAGTYYVDDDEHHQSRVVLLAPGVDLTHPAVPDEVIQRILEHAALAKEFVFLAMAFDLDRIRAFDWPENVRPVALASTPSEAVRSVTAFVDAETEGVLVVRDASDAFRIDDSEANAALSAASVDDGLAAVLVRGYSTSARALQSILALRRHGVSVQVGSDVKQHAVEPVFDPAAFQATSQKPGRRPNDLPPEGTSSATRSE